jgi:hypothetical protein
MMKIRKSQVRWLSAMLAGAICAWTMAAQAPATQSAKGSTAQGSTSNPPAPQYPAPTNLQALPKTMTGQQVHDLMEEWSRQLNTTCDGCHAYDRNHLGPDGKLALNYADDSKDMKRVARMMVTMMDLINTNYISKVEGSGVPVSCGMCHRGDIGAQPYEPRKAVDLPAREIHQVDCAEQELEKAAQARR